MTDTARDTAMPAEIASLVERLRINAESWRRDDALEARDESEGDLADEAAAAILALQKERDEQWRRANVLAQQNAYHKDRAEAAEARVAELEKALEPFAKACARAEAGNAHFGGIHAKDVPDSQKYGVLGVTWGHLRAARRALAGGKEE